LSFSNNFLPFSGFNAKGFFYALESKSPLDMLHDFNEFEDVDE
jgi:hypothetical protein